MTSAKSTQLRILSIVVIVVAYGFLVYKLVCFDDYSVLAAEFSHAGWRQYGALCVALLLMPVNMLVEALKWRSLLRNVEPISLRESIREVYFGVVGAFVTPYRAGELPARAMMLPHPSQWTAAIGMGLVGVMATLMVELVLGIPASIGLTTCYGPLSIQDVYWVVALIGILIGIGVWGMKKLADREWKNEQLGALFRAIRQTRIGHLCGIIGWSFVRYIIWAIQLIGASYFCGIVLAPWQWAMAIPTYYMLVAIMPSVPVADAAIRGSWGMVVFSLFTNNSIGIALAAILVWIINTLLPMIGGSSERWCK